MRHLFLLFLFLLAPLAPLHSAQDQPDSIAHLRSDAEQGDAESQGEFGLLYDLGQGVAQDYVEARKWFLKAAEQGGAHAQVELGVLYHFGYGVAQDYVEARKWWLKAAEQGDPDAQYGLGGLYNDGHEDYTMAYVWFNIAASQGEAEQRKRSPRRCRCEARRHFACRGSEAVKGVLQTLRRAVPIKPLVP